MTLERTDMPAAEFHPEPLLGRRIRLLRKQRGLSREEVAQRMGMAVSDLVRVEKGERSLNLDCLFQLLCECGAGGDPA